MIGIFDSGVGGLTVAHEIKKKLPNNKIIYFGDTARTPYGPKSPEIITKYSIENTKFLLNKGAKIIIVACNSASAVAADKLKRKFPKVPIFEVITPAVAAAKLVTVNNKIGVIGTRATIETDIYNKKISHKKNSYQIFNQACPLFVPLAEEGWTNTVATKKIADTYLLPLKRKGIDTLILGCTHYPLLRSVIQASIGNKVKLVDPAVNTALAVKKYLSQNPQLAKELQIGKKHDFYFSDLSPALNKFITNWLGQKITPKLHIIK
ncbi:MAG: glutamate racemase [bacterium]|nr:glutamate racemase [bacterium]